MNIIILLDPMWALYLELLVCVEVTVVYMGTWPLEEITTLTMHLHFYINFLYRCAKTAPAAEEGRRLASKAGM